jgi:hypothetical protein
LTATPWNELQPAGTENVMNSDRYVPGATWPDGGSVGAEEGLCVAAGVAVGGALRTAVGIGEDVLVGIEATAPAVHALARRTTAIATTRLDTRG